MQTQPSPHRTGAERVTLVDRTEGQESFIEEPLRMGQERKTQRETETDSGVTASVGWRGTALETEVPITRWSVGRVLQGIVFAL